MVRFIYRLHASNSAASLSICCACRTPGSCVSCRCRGTTTPTLLTGCLNCPVTGVCRGCGDGRFVLAGVTVTRICRLGGGAGSLKVTVWGCCWRGVFSWPDVIWEWDRLWPAARAIGLRIGREMLDEALVEVV